MTEFDFDELDKAVNSLMSDSAIVQKVSEYSMVKTLPASDAPASVLPSSDVDAETTPKTQDTGSKPATPSQSLATKRRGQFMDVMHPSSKMKTQDKPVRLGVTPRHNTTLEPISSPMQSESESVADQPNQPDAGTAMVINTPSVESPVWPEAVEKTTDDATEPLSTPFIPGAVVEKRPLGKSQPTGKLESEEVIPVAPVADMTSTVLPSELSGDLLAVESSELGADEQPVDKTPPVSLEQPTEVASANQPEAIDKAEDPTPPESEKETVSTVEASTTTATSITPQYQLADSEADPADHDALYDNIHAEVSMPAKKKNGWLVPVAVIGLILLGSAGGVAIYYLLLGK